MKKRIFLLVFTALFFSNSWSQKVTNNTKSVTVLWDTSLSMINRNIEKDFSFLSSYFEVNPWVIAKVVVFNNEIVEKKIFNVNDKNWNELKNYLENVIYDGSTNFQALKKFIEPESEIFLFSDSNNNSGEEFSLINSNDFVINSNEEMIEKSLSNRNFFSGYIYINTEPLRNVRISVKGNSETALSDSTGNFKINAKVGDTLLFESKGNDSIKYLLEKNDKILVTFFSKVESLDEVVVKTKGKFDKNEKVITALGEKNKNAVGYAVQSITDEDISPSVSNVSQAVQGKFSGARYGQNDDLSQIIIRGGGNSILSNNYGLIVIDGVPMPRSDSSGGGVKSVQSSSFLDPNNIENVTILKGLAATNRYGSLGNNGVILITTKTAAYDTTNRKNKLKILNNNVYSDESIAFDKEKKSISYIKKLSKLKTIKNAYIYYLNQRLQYLNDPEYFLNVYDFFKQSNKQLANKILSNILELFPKEIGALRLLAFKYDSERDYKSVLKVYKRILELNSSNSQPYLDLANAYVNDLNLEESLKIYKNITEGKMSNEIDFSGLSKTIDNDFRNFIRQKKANINTTEIKPKYLHNTQYDARLVLKWNNPDAQFVVQFVNPIKRFITWDHTFDSNGQRIKDEMSKGYFTEEFHIDGDIKELKGEWIMNIKDLGSKKNIPNYFQITLYSNFGRSNQSKIVKLFSSDNIGENENVLKFKIY